MSEPGCLSKPGAAHGYLFPHLNLTTRDAAFYNEPRNRSSRCLVWGKEAAIIGGHKCLNNEAWIKCVKNVFRFKKEEYLIRLG